VNQSHSSIAAFEASINKLEAYLAKQTSPRPLHEVEADVLALVREIGQAAIARYVAQCGTGDQGTLWQDPAGKTRRRHGVRSRQYRSLFGPVAIARAYYHRADLGGVAPLDAKLALPERSYSYLLQGLVVRLAATSAYDTARDALDRLLGTTVPKAIAEAIVAEHAADVAAFQTALPAPAGEGAVLVVQVDGKGVPMVCPKVEELPGPRIRPKAVGRRGKKKMAVVISLYTIDPEPFGPPKPINRKVYAFIGPKRSAFEWLAAEAKKRGYGSKATLFLSDGDLDLAELQAEMLPLATPCLDWIHATEYLWDAAHALYREGSVEAREWVKAAEGRMLAGNASHVIRGLKQSLTKRKRRLGKARKKALSAVIGYLERNKDRMPYKTFFEAGYPFATGSVEGACRHHVADRMEGTGMRWKESGAQAILHARSIQLNGESDEFTRFRIKREQERLYASYTSKEAAA
jgi:hypothetical protein